MPQSLVQLYTHLIFSTKNRERLIAREMRDPLANYLGGILANLECQPLTVGCMGDHVHLFFLLSKGHVPFQIVEEVKRGSSKWIKTEGPGYANFYWQRGYGMFSVSVSKVPAVVAYIERQETHHRRVTFQEEFREFLRHCGVEYDERYVWD